MFTFLWLNFMIMLFYYIFVLFYIIIGRHAYRDARVLHGQLVMYVLKHFICQCLLYVKVTGETHNEFHITKIISVWLYKIT